MKKPIIIFLLAIPLLCMAQNPPHSLTCRYDYDDAGNRILRKMLTIYNAPPAPPDSLQVTSDELQVTSDESQELRSEQFFVEKVAQVEIKIYPNPTTEKITLEISNLENLSEGVFKLYSLNGQLLQEQPVHSITTTVSLAGMPAGAYILKVQINDQIEDWKIIKQ
jgi:hypothetical protein